jgi:hypothetical protein
MKDVVERVAAGRCGVIWHGRFYWTLSVDSSVRDGDVQDASAGWPLSLLKMIGWSRLPCQNTADVVALLVDYGHQSNDLSF